MNEIDKKILANSVETVRAALLLLPFLVSSCGVRSSEDRSRPEQSVSSLRATETLTVGPGQTYALPSEAARASKPGDIIRIFPGIYTDCAQWEADGLLIEGVGAGVTVTGKVCDDKGLFVTKGHDIRVRNITFSSAHASGHNGSGIRAEGANLTVEDSRFINNEDGILAGGYPGSKIFVSNSYFSGNGNCIAECAHGIYVGKLALLRVENSEFSEQHVGHHIKSRAARTEIIDNSIYDGPRGSSSYLVDLPNGGAALIARNKFEKGPNSQNRQVAIAILAEKDKIPNPDGQIVIENNTFLNDTGSPTTFVQNFGNLPVVVRDNNFEGDVTAYSEVRASDE